MVTGSKAMSAGQAATYFTGKDNYYMKDGITEVGKWGGKGAEALGLKGDVDQKQFVEVLNGYKPGSLTDDQIKQLETLNKTESTLSVEAKDIAKMPDGEEKLALKADLDARIASYNESRADFHKDVKTGGLHSQIKELKAAAKDKPELMKEVKALEKEMRGALKNDFKIGDTVSPADRENFGKVTGFDEEGRAKVTLTNPETGKEATKTFELDNLVNMSSKEEGRENSLGGNGGQIVRDGHDEHGIATHRAGFDFTFSAPKSFSTMALVAGDDRLFAVHAKAMNTAMDYLEKEFAQTRTYDENGDRQRENTENLAYAQFNHYTSRATDKDATPDPQLHTHNLILNTTKAGEKLMSLEPQQLFAAQKLADQIYQNELARGAKELGYGIEWNRHDKNYTAEIKGVDRELMDALSSRTVQIEGMIKQQEKEHGRPMTAEEKNNVTLSSRASKDEQDIGKLKETWDETIKDLGYSREGLEHSTSQQVSDKTIATGAEQSVKMAIEQLQSQKAVFSEHEILHEALKAAQGTASVKEIQAALKENTKEMLVNDTDTFKVGVDRDNNETVLYSSKAVLRAEANIEKAVADGKNTGAIMSKEEFSKHFEEVKATKMAEAEKTGKEFFDLTDGQKQVLEHMATSNDQFVGVQGDAGAGKTKAIEYFKEIVDRHNITAEVKIDLIGLAPTNKAASTLEKDSGVKSRTIDSFINKPEAAQEGKQQFFIVDESSMLDTIKLGKLTDVATKNGAKTSFQGDRKQLTPVGQGSMFNRLESTEKMSFAYATEVLRQKTDLTKDTVAAFKNIETVGKGLDRLQEAGELITAGKDGDMNAVRDKFINNSANDYSKNMESTISLVATNADRELFNEAIRAKLIETGDVSKDGQKSEVLKEKRLGKTDKQFAGNYKVGDVLVADRGMGAIKSGTKTTIAAINRADNSIKLSYLSKAGAEHSKWISADKTDSFTAFEKAEKEFAAGDKIAFERKDKDIGVQKDDTGIIKGIGEDGKWTVDMGEKTVTVDPASYPFVNHAYAMTVYKSQGQSVEKVHVWADSSKGGLSLNAGYVQMSRAQYELTVYTDNRENLEKQYSRTQIAENAGEYTDTKQFAGVETEKANTFTVAELDSPAGVFAPKLSEYEKETRLDRIEESFVKAAKEEIKALDAQIAAMRSEAKEQGEGATDGWKDSRGVMHTQQSRSHAIYHAARAGAEAKDIKAGIRYQQLSKTEAKIMAHGEIDLKSAHEFVAGKGFENEGQKNAFMASQAREREHLDGMVKDGMLIKDPNESDRYELAVSRADFTEYRNSEKAHEHRSEIAEGDWNKAVRDQSYNHGQSRVDGALIAGGSWNAKDGIKQMKVEGLYTKDNEVTMERLQARYDRLAKEGVVKKDLAGNYTAANPQQLKNYVGSDHDKSGKIMGEGQNAQQYKEMKQLKADTSFIPSASRIDKEIGRMTHVNLHVLSRDISSTHREVSRWIGSHGDPIMETLAGVVGTTLGTAKTATRAAAGLAYKAAKATVKIAGKIVSGEHLLEGGAVGAFAKWAEHYEHKHAEIKEKWAERIDKFFSKHDGKDKSAKVAEAREKYKEKVEKEREKLGLKNPDKPEHEKTFDEKLAELMKPAENKLDHEKTQEDKLAEALVGKVDKDKTDIENREDSLKSFNGRFEEVTGRKFDDKDETLGNKDNQEEKSDEREEKSSEKEASKEEERSRND